MEADSINNFRTHLSKRMAWTCDHFDPGKLLGWHGIVLFLRKVTMTLLQVIYIYQIIATSHDLTLKGSWEREIPLFQGNLGWWNSIIWPDICILFLSGVWHFYDFCMLCLASLVKFGISRKNETILLEVFYCTKCWAVLELALVGLVGFAPLSKEISTTKQDIVVPTCNQMSVFSICSIHI